MERTLQISPEGSLHTLVFSGAGRCGKALDGIVFNIRGEAGSVITNEDAKALRDYIDEHLRIYGK